jgi:hypothetical protein
MASWQSALFGNENAARIRKFMFGSIVVQDYVASAASGYAATTYSPFASADGSFQASSPGASGATGWFDLGFSTADGVTFARNVSGDDVTGWQSRNVLRHDVTADGYTAQFTQMETKPSVLALVNNLPLGSLSLTSSAGINFARPQATSVYRTAIFYGADGIGAQANYCAIMFPYCSVTDFGDVQLSPGGVTQYQLTITAFVDQFMQADSRVWYDGPGFRAQSTLNP